MLFHGVIKKVFKYEENTGKSIFAFKAEEAIKDKYLTSYGTIICIGQMSIEHYRKMDIADTVIDGVFYTDGKFVCSSVLIDKNNKKKLIDYISGGICPGIGKILAEKIAALDGLNDIDEFVKRKDAVAVLSKINGISRTKAEEFVKAILREDETKYVYQYLNRFGGSYFYASLMFNRYGENSLKLLKKYPYKCCYEIGIPFRIAEKIGKSLNVSKYNYDRIMALTRHILATDLATGNTEMSIARFITRAKCYDAPYQMLLASVSRMTDISYGDGYLYFNKVRKMEEEISFHIKRLNENREIRKLPNNLQKSVETISGIKYAPAQSEVFNIVSSSGIKIMTGGPGTGKTTTIKGVITAFKMIKENPKIKLAAPTGRAAQRLTEAVGMGYAAQTVHKLLEYTPFGNGYSSKDEYDEIDADLIVIDEFSMVDVELFNMLIKAVKKNAILLLSGDINQLPSVGAGAIMRDMMTSSLFEVHKLNEIYRQADGSKIISNSRKISMGNYTLDTGDDFYIFKTDDAVNSLFTIDALMGKLYDPQTPFSCQILCPSKGNSLGIEALNKRYETAMNKSIMEPYVYDDREFKAGDKILFTRNNYNTGYFNGEIGIVESISGEGLRIKREKDFIDIKGADVADIELAYAMTIHKSQGCEYDNVIVVLPKLAQGMLCRNLLFTAVTRARKKVFIINESDSLTCSIAQINHMERETGLKKLLKR